MESNETPPIAVNASPIPDQLSALGRTLLLLVSVVTALAGFIGKRDLAGFITFVQSSEFLTAASAVIALGTFLWGQWKTRHRAKQLAVVGEAAPNYVATVKP